MLNRHPEYQYLELLKHGSRRKATPDRPHRYRDLVGLRRDGAVRRQRPRADPDDQAGLLENRHQGNALVPDRQNQYSGSAQGKCPDLDRLAACPLSQGDRRRDRQEVFEKRIVYDDAFAAAMGRSRAGLWQAMASLAGAGRPRIRSDRGRHRRLEKQPDQPPHPVPRLERRGNRPDGAASLPYGLSVSRRQRAAVMPFVPAQRRRPARATLSTGPARSLFRP